MKIDRLIGILALLLQQERVTAPQLARTFEVSRRTIQRDVEALCRAGIPLVTTQGQGGGISIMEGYRIDSTLLTSGDMQAILAGLRSLDSVSGTNRYAQLMEKLSAGTGGLVPGGARAQSDQGLTGCRRGAGDGCSPADEKSLCSFRTQAFLLR